MCSLCLTHISTVEQPRKLRMTLAALIADSAGLPPPTEICTALINGSGCPRSSLLPNTICAWLAMFYRVSEKGECFSTLYSFSLWLSSFFLILNTLHSGCVYHFHTTFARWSAHLCRARYYVYLNLFSISDTLYSFRQV